MFNTQTIEKITQYIHEFIPQFIQDFTCNLDSKIRQILQNQLNRMNFINRDEFDIHSQILFETQEKLKKLETKIKILESIYQHKFNENKNSENLKE